MATSFSEKQLNFARKKYYGKLYFTNINPDIFMVIVNKLLIFILNFKVSLVNLKRFIFSNLIKSYPKKSNDSINVDLIAKDLDLKTYSNKLQKDKYVFIENFLNNKTYNQILASWPNINFFKLRNKIIKFYSYGFSSTNGEFLSSDIKYFNQNNKIRELYNFFNSSKFNNYINKMLDFENINYNIYSIDASMAGDNSYLIPHVDGIINGESKAYNFIYFVDGNDEDIEFSGGTSIYEDNDFQKLLCMPTTLKNSLLVYNSTNKFYHGFKLTKLPKNFYRKTINFQFFSN